MAYVQARKNATGKITSYTIRVFKGRDLNGKQLKPYTKTFKVNPQWTEKQMQKELEKAVVLFEEECKKGIVADNRQTFEKYAQYVLGLKERMGLKHRTLERYKELLTRIVPSIGFLKLAEIKPQHLNKLYEELSQVGLNKITGGKLSNKTILEHHKLIHTILNQAEKEMLISYNPATRTTPPKLVKKEANYIEIDDIHRILEYVKLEPLKKQVMINLLIFTGCRRGEIMGLTWDAIDFNNNQIRISKSLLYSKQKGVYVDTPKTEQSKRVLTVPASVIDLLKIYKKEQNKNKLKLGSAWTDSKFVLTQDNGKPMHPDSLTSFCVDFRTKYNKIIEEYNKNITENNKIKLLPHLNPHAFRHSQASMLLYNSVDIVTVSKRLGHAKVSTTTDIYSHIMQKADTLASNVLESVFSSPISTQKTGSILN